MASTKFPTSQIERFNDRIENVLNDANCRRVFEFYLTSVIRKRNLIKVLKLWTKVNQSTSFDDDIFDLIDEIDGFQDDQLLTHSEQHLKVDYVKNECCRLFNRDGIHKRFVDYLVERHRE